MEARAAPLQPLPAADLLGDGGSGAADRGDDRPRCRDRRVRRGDRRLALHRDRERGPAADRGGAAAPVHARARLPGRPLPRRGDARARVGCPLERDHGRLLLVGAAHRARRGRRHGRRRRRHRRERRRHLHAAGDPADRPAGPGERDPRPTCPGSSSSRSTGSPCRSCSGRCATGTCRPWPAGWPRTPTGSRSGSPISRRRPARARRASCSAPTRTSPPSAGWTRRRSIVWACSAPGDCAEIERRHSSGRGLLRDGGREPRQPALGRGGPRDPDREPDGGGEEGEPRLPGVLRQRVQRHACPRALRVGGDPRMARRPARDPPRRAAAGAPRRPLPVHAGCDVRRRPRPDRLRRAHAT